MTFRTSFAALAVTALLGGALVGCGEDADPVEETDSAQDSPTSTPDPSESSEPTEPPATTEPESGETTTAPLYFVGETPRGDRLFREFRKVSADNPLEGAAALLSAGDVLDPDYRTLFPGGDLGMIGLDEEADEIRVFLPDDTLVERPSGMSKRSAQLAVQSLVYTLQGVSQTRNPLVVATADDATPTSLLGVDTSGGVTSKKQLKVLGLVNVTTPEEGASVSGSITASGVASSFEGTVPWEVRDSAGEVVVDGFATAEGFIDRLYPWETQVDLSGLAPGDYTFVAMTDDPSGGEGFGPTEDSKAITIK